MFDRSCNFIFLLLFIFQKYIFQVQMYIIKYSIKSMKISNDGIFLLDLKLNC